MPIYQQKMNVAYLSNVIFSYKKLIKSVRSVSNLRAFFGIFKRCSALRLSVSYRYFAFLEILEMM